MTGLTVSPEPQSSRFYDHDVSQLQGTDLAVSGNSIVGTLKFIEGGLSPAGPLAGDGFFLALHFTDSDATSIKVGLDPSEGTGLVELKGDPDMCCIAKITDKNTQFFIVEQSDNKGNKLTQRFYLGGLTLEEPES